MKFWGVYWRFIPSLPNPISPIPISPKFFPFRPFFFHPFQLRPFPIPPNICPLADSPNFIFAYFSFRPEAISPNFPISRNDHFALFPQGPFPFHLISGPKTNKEFSNNLMSQFWTLS